MIKTVSGVDIGGRETGDDMIDVCEGDDYLVSFRFNCYLNPGVYFLNAGALGMVDGSEVFLDRRVDLIQFRVLPNTFHHTGSLDLVVDTSIEQHC
jgi:lipopolysaccharide transport system ATP-binding protein